jgi:hypothetical protein
MFKIYCFDSSYSLHCYFSKSNILIGSFLEVAVVEREDDEDVRVLEEPFKEKTTSKRSKGKMLKTEDEDKEDRGARWKNDDIKMLIALRGEMDDDFKKNGKKPGN